MLLFHVVQSLAPDLNGMERAGCNIESIDGLRKGGELSQVTLALLFEPSVHGEFSSVVKLRLAGCEDPERFNRESWDELSQADPDGLSCGVDC